MVHRLLPAALLVTSGTLSAAPIRNVNTISYEYRDMQLASRSPKLKRPDHLNILSGRSVFLYEQSKLNSQAEIGASSGNSGDTSFTALDARAGATWRDAHSSDTLEASWLRTHGADSTQRPLEETILGDDDPFTATRVGYRHQHELGSMDGVNVGASIGRNIDGLSDLESREVTAAWAHLLSKTWTNTLNLIRGTQKVRNGISSDSWELRNDDLWILSPEWSAQTGLGALSQKVDTEKKNTFVGGVAFAYVLRTANPDKKNEKAQPIGQDMIRRPDLDRLENVRTQSQFRFGWERSLDERIKGDSQFVADQYFAQGLWVIDPDQNLQVDAQRSLSVDKNVPGAQGVVRDVANLDYRWNMQVGGSSSGLVGSFGLGITQERVKQDTQFEANGGRIAPQRYDRQVLRVSYAVSF